MIFGFLWNGNVNLECVNDINHLIFSHKIQKIKLNGLNLRNYYVFAAISFASAVQNVHECIEWCGCVVANKKTKGCLRNRITKKYTHPTKTLAATSEIKSHILEIR